MDKNQMQNQLKKSLQGAKKTLQGATKSLQGATQSVKTAAHNVMMNQVRKAEGEEMASYAHSPSNGITANAKTSDSRDAIHVISTKYAIKVFYYLMAVDGEIFHNEEEKFDEIGLQIDPNYNNHKETIIKDCKTVLDSSQNEDEYYEVVRRGVQKTIRSADSSEDSFITPKAVDKICRVGMQY